MPSSPGPNDYTRIPERFFTKGIQLQPQDQLSPGKLVFAENMRSYMNGTIRPRDGVAQIADPGLGAAIHSIFRLNDTTPYAGPTEASVRFLGAADGLWAGDPSGLTYTPLDSGFSGSPLSAVVVAPVATPRPWLYVGDSNQLRKYNTALAEAPWGIAPPFEPPTAELTSPQRTFLNEIGAATWVPYGADAGAVTLVLRIDTVVTELIYDQGSTGMASVALSSMENLCTDATVTIGGIETIIVQEILGPIAPTTIEAILYDSGNTGMCTIQPTGSIYVGQSEIPLPDEVRRRYEDLDVAAPPLVTVTRTLDFPVNALILLGGVEVVRIQSVTLGKDGVMSFRCSTAGTFAAGAAITGMPSFRCWFDTTRAVGDLAQAVVLENVITQPTTDAIVGGVQSPALAGFIDWGKVGLDRSTSPDDWIRFGVKVSNLEFIEGIRLYLNVNDDGGSGATFLENYYFYEWRANDLLAAIQQAVGDATQLVSDVQAGAVQQGQTDAQYDDQYGHGYGSFDAALDRFRSKRATGGDGQPHGSISAARARLRARIEQTRLDGAVTASSALSRQLALGNDQWLTLHCRVGDLTRVGTDLTRTLSLINACAITLQVAEQDSAAAPPITVQYSDGYLLGGFGPDVGPTLPPYVYRYRYRSTDTGERSNPSPPMRAGVRPRRGRVLGTGVASSHPLCDVIDWFRFGGTLNRWEYVKTTPNATPNLVDDETDAGITGGEPIRTDLFQPFPISDLPRKGTCNVAGTSIAWISGDQFNTAWSADTAVIINGIATTLFKPPSSQTQIEVHENCGAGTNVQFTLPSPTLMGQALPAVFGGPINGTWFTFGVGDPSDPGSLWWTHGNDPDASSDTNRVVVTSASEPLQNGFFFDGVPYVFSTDKLYRIVPTFGSIATFVAIETPCTKGLWSRWAFCILPNSVVFLGKDGIYETSAGSEAVNITSPDLKILFPQDGTNPEPIRTLYPVDYTQPERLRLSYIDSGLYFDYVDTNGNDRTFFGQMTDGAWGWWPDVYAVSGARVRVAEGGPEIHNNIFGGGDGILYQVSSDKITDVEDNIPWTFDTGWTHGGDPRQWKQWGDSILDFNPGFSTFGVSATPLLNNGNTLGTPTTGLGIGGTVRQTYIVEVEQGEGIYSRNFGLRVTGECDICDINRPLFYLWEPSFLPKQVSVARRATDWENLGYKGAKFIQGVIIRANTFNQQKRLLVEYDGPNGAPQIALEIAILHNGEQEIAYPISDEGWNPFIGQLVRLHGNDDVEWTLLDWRWVWEPAPELATQWETQDTTFGYPGFMHVFDGVTAYESEADVELTIWHDQTPLVYTFPATGGEYQRVHQIFQATKGKSVRFSWWSDLPFRLYKSDCSFRVQPWGVPGGYATVRPFGGPHNEDGAGI